MKKIYSMVALIIFGSSTLLAQTAQEEKKQEVTQSIPTDRSGHEMIESLRKGYESNSFDAFLANLNSDYQKASEGGKIVEFAQMRESPAPDQKLKDIVARWESVHQKLLEERNVELASVIVGQESSVIVQQIRSIITPLPADQKEALQYVASLRFKTPTSAVNEDEKKLIEIDLASEFKTVHLDAQYVQKPFEDRFEKHAILGMEMMDQMQQASQSFKDAHLQKTIELASAGYDTWQARNWDLNLLNQVVKKPSNDVERKIASIFSNYKVKKDDLYQKEFLAKVEPQK